MFTDSDSFMEHLSDAIKGIEDNAVSSRYVGFVAVSAVTIYEVVIKKSLKDCAATTHPMLGTFASVIFEKLNARIRREDIESYLKYYGAEYVDRFKELVDQKEQEHITDGSVKSSYANILTWRHEFVHAGQLPSQATFAEAVKSYHLGKHVVIALDEVMKQTPVTTTTGDA